MNKKTKNLISWSVGLIFIVGLIVLMVVNRDHNSKSTVYSVSNLTVMENNFDFGTISMKDGNVSHNFEITNQGSEPVIIGKVYTSCMCTTALIIDNTGRKYGEFGMPGHGSLSRANLEVGPGKSIIVEAIYDPAAHGPSGVGLVQRSIYLETNSARVPKLELTFQAMVAR